MKILRTRGMVPLAGFLLLAGILSLPGQNVPGKGVETNECAFSDPDHEENELFWETLSRQFSGSVATY